MANPKGNAEAMRAFRFEKGQSGNPSGKPKDLLTMDQVKIIMQRFQKMTKKELMALVEDENSTMIECMIGSIICKAITLGDPARLEFLMARTWGKVKDEAPERQNYNPVLDNEPRENILKVLRDLRGPKIGS